MFARGDRVFPGDDLGGGIWSRRGTVLAVHTSPGWESDAGDDQVRVETIAGSDGAGSPTRRPSASSSAPPVARATVLWDDGSAEVVAEDQLCLVYDQQPPVGIRVVTMPMEQPCDVAQIGGQVILVLREGLLGPSELAALREKLGRVRAVPTTGRQGNASAAELRRRDLELLHALIAELTGGGPAAGR